MEVEGVTPGQPAVSAEDAEAIAAAQAAFTEAVGTVIFSVGMNVVGMMSEQLAELEKEE